MLWQATSEPQRHALRGYVGVPEVGRSADMAASQEPSPGGHRA